MDNRSTDGEPRGRKRHRDKGRVTLSDVAREAGVAPITVSRALNTPQRVSEQVRARVDAAVEALGYVPNLIAGGLASAGTRVIPVIVPSLSILTFIEVVHGIQQTLESAGHQMLLASTDFDLDREAQLVNTVLGYSPSGVILTGLRHRPAVVERLREWGRPVIEIMEYGEDCIDMSVGVDGHALGRFMADYLAGKSYHRILFAGSNMERDYRARQRWQGFRDRLTELGLEADLLLEYEQPASYRIGVEALDAALAMPESPDAIHFSNDILATGALLEAQRRGVKVPEQIAVTGYLGLELGEFLNPPLTTLSVARMQMGVEAASMLLARLAGETPVPPRRDIGFNLVEGGSA